MFNSAAMLVYLCAHDVKKCSYITADKQHPKKSLLIMLIFFNPVYCSCCLV